MITDIETPANRIALAKQLVKNMREGNPTSSEREIQRRLQASLVNTGVYGAICNNIVTTYDKLVALQNVLTGRNYEMIHTLALGMHEDLAAYDKESYTDGLRVFYGKNYRYKLGGIKRTFKDVFNNIEDILEKMKPALGNAGMPRVICARIEATENKIFLYEQGLANTPEIKAAIIYEVAYYLAEMNQDKENKSNNKYIAKFYDTKYQLSDGTKPGMTCKEMVAALQEKVTAWSAEDAAMLFFYHMVSRLTQRSPKQLPSTQTISLFTTNQTPALKTRGTHCAA